MDFHSKGVTPETVHGFLAKGIPFVLATVVDAGRAELVGRKLLVPEGGVPVGSTGVAQWDSAVVEHSGKILSKGPQLLEVEEGFLFLDPLLPVADLIICGAGHIALPLARFALDLGYRVTVVDDREDFASPARFPGCEILARDFSSALSDLRFGRTTYAVVITRGHVHDIECLHAILPRETAYVGLIGSRRRIGFVKKELAASGILQERIDGLHTPIGLAIGAESPAEIALSIMAEITAVRRLGPDAGRFLSKEANSR